MTISEHEYEINSMKSALERRVESLKDNILFSDVEILSPSKTYYAHKLVLSARSSDWGRGEDLSLAVLDWRNFRDETCEDIINYLYTDTVDCLKDKLYDELRVSTTNDQKSKLFKKDIRVIQLMSAASLYLPRSQDHHVNQNGQSRGPLV